MKTAAEWARALWDRKRFGSISVYMAEDIIQQAMDEAAADMRERCTRAEGWLARVVQGFESGSIKPVSLVQRKPDGSLNVVCMKEAILEAMGWELVDPPRPETPHTKLPFPTPNTTGA